MTAAPETEPRTNNEPDQDPLGYAQAIAELEDILDELDDDTIDIDVLSTKVERAAELIRFCRTRIRTAEARVSEIVADLADLESDEDE